MTIPPDPGPDAQWREALTGAAPPAGEAALDEYLSRPTPGVVASMGALDGDLLVLGAGGKLGLSVATMATRALRAGGSAHRVRAVSRFHDGADRFDAAGVETISADLLEDGAL